jgi:hypothetical protein
VAAGGDTEEPVMTMVEAARHALAELGDVSNEELAAFVAKTYGLTIRAGIMPVVRAAVKDKENLEARRRRAAEAAAAGTGGGAAAT